MRWAGWAIVGLGAWTAFTGAWGVIETMTTADAGDEFFWLGSALLTAGIALVLVGLRNVREVRL